MITIDEHFKNLIQPLTPLERSRLEENIQDAGKARNPLVVWPVDGEQVLIDGHNRYEICTEFGLPFTVDEVEFADRDEAEQWILKEQLGRRNLDPVVASELRGRLYNSRKKANGGDRKSVPQIEELKQTSVKVAEETGVSRATIERDGKFAEAIDKVRPLVHDIQDKLRSHEVSKAQVISAACCVETEPELAREKLAAAPSREKRRPVPDLWFCLVNGDPLSAADIAVSMSDPEVPLTGDLVFASASDAVDEGSKHYDPDDCEAMTVNDFLRGAADHE